MVSRIFKSHFHQIILHLRGFSLLSQVFETRWGFFFFFCLNNASIEEGSEKAPELAAGSRGNAEARAVCFL